MTVGLRSIASFVPETVRARATFDHFAPYVPMEFFPLERRVDLRADAAEHMALNAAKLALARAGIEATDVDLIISQNLGGRFITPGIGAFLQRELGCRIETPAWNIQQVCAGFVDGCRMAQDALLARPESVRNVLVVNCSSWFSGEWGVDLSSPSSAAVGDGAAAGVVSADDVRLEFLAYHNRTHSEIYEDLVVQVTTPENPGLLADLRVQNNRAIMVVSPRFPEWMANVGKNLPVWLIGEATRKAGMDYGDVDFVVTHQAQGLTIDLWKQTLEAEARVPREKWRETWHQHGNIGGADAALNLDHLMRDESPDDGSIIALFSPGGAGHSPMILLRVRN